jgi:hypothetical protein
MNHTLSHKNIWANIKKLIRLLSEHNVSELKIDNPGKTETHLWGWEIFKVQPGSSDEYDWQVTDYNYFKFPKWKWKVSDPNGTEMLLINHMG